MFNVTIGIIWQMVMIIGPIYFMIRDNLAAALCVIVFGLCTWILKKNWWDLLEKRDDTEGV
jgi:solute:Na+ symporter, SSS family